MQTSTTIDELVSRWVRPEVRRLAAYHVPEPSDYIKLDAMENPYAWPPALVDQWLERLREVHLNRYPDSGAQLLSNRLREAMGVPAEARILLGNGSDELIQMIALAVGGPGRVILAPEPSFVMYRLIALFAGMQYVGVPLRTHDFGLEMEVMKEAIAATQPAVIFLAYPNNPTGNLFPEEQVAEILRAAPGLVVVDEAYAPFAGASFLAQLGRYGNLLVMRTVSKMGLAGLRLGYLLGDARWIEQLDKVRLPYNINTLTQASAEFALAHRAVFDQQTARIREDRLTLFQSLQGMPGITPFPSRTNFILFRTQVDANQVFATLQRAGILIKNLHGSSTLLENCLRVTVGQPSENQIFLDGLAQAITA